MRPSSASTSLSSSALNYLESLERNAKALRGNQNGSVNKKDESSITSTSKQISSVAPVKRRESITDIISQVRRRSSLSRTNSEDFDFLNESLKSSVFDESVSSEAESEESHEEKRILPLGTPGQQVGRKSLKDIRELRNSIDQFLIKTPELKMLRTKADESRKLQHFESIREEDVPEDLPKTQLPSKSPFKKAIQSGSESSDADSIVFDEVFEEVLPSPPRKPDPIRVPDAPVARNVSQKPVEPPKRKEKKKERTPTPTSSDSSSSSESTSESESSSESSTSSTKTSISKAASKSQYGSDFDSEKSSSSSSSTSSSSASTLSKASSAKPPKLSKRNDEKSKKLSLVPYEDFIPKRRSSSESSKSTVRETQRTLEESIKMKTIKLEDKKRMENDKINEHKDNQERKNQSKEVKIVQERKKLLPSSSSSFSSVVGETERELDYQKRRERKFRSRRRRSEEPHTCQENIHNMIESVIDTHVKMLDEFNQMEYAAVCQWTNVIRTFEHHDGPTSQRLREIVANRLNRKY